MKRFIKVILAIFVISLFGMSASAENGDIIGHIYSTDILAVISGNEVPSYNIGGKTVIILEDLNDKNLGFASQYNENERLLTVYAGTAVKLDTHIERGKTGKILGDVYDTDIRVMLCGQYIKGYNIGGKTAVCLEELGDLTDSPNAEYGYSKFLARANWNEADRTISLDFADARPEDELTTKVTQFVFSYENNVLTPCYDDLNRYMSFYGKTKLSDEFKNEKYIVKPLYLNFNGEKEEIGFCYVDENGAIYTNFFDINSVAEKLIEYKKAHKQKLTYDEVIKKFNDGVAFTTLYSIETEDYTMLVAKKASEENCVDYVAVSRDGDYVVMYTEDTYEETTLEKTGENTVTVTVSPFAGPHGATKMSMEFNLEDYIRLSELK